MSEQSETRLRDVLESMSEGYITFDRAWRVQYVNPRGELMLGRPAAELIGRDIWEAFPQARSVAALGRLRDAMERRVAVEFDDEYTPAGRWFEVRAYPTDEGMAVFFRDVTASRKARHFTELSHRLLAETGAALATKLDVRELLASFVKVVVPSFADALVLSLHEDDDTLVRLEPYAEPPDRDLTSALPAGVETDAMLREVAFGGEPLRLAPSTPAHSGFAATVRGLGYRDVVIVPLTATGRTRGALALLAREPGRYGE
jgi:PAS domain S-box-containing protein